MGIQNGEKYCLVLGALQLHLISCRETNVVTININFSITNNEETAMTPPPEVSELVKKTVLYETVSYGMEDTSKIDIYGTSLPKDSPIFVYIHGGFWQELNKDISCYPVEPLVKSGIRVYVPGYSLAPQAKVGEIVEQIKIMGEYVLNGAAESGVRSVWFGGHSAGAHLAASLLDKVWFERFESSIQRIFKGLFLISGIYDLVPIVQTYVNEPLKLDITIFRNQAENLSPIKKNLKWFTELNKEFMVALAVAENDSPSFKVQTTDFEQFLTSHKITTELFYLSELDHFDIVENLKKEEYTLTVSIIDLIRKKC